MNHAALPLIDLRLDKRAREILGLEPMTRNGKL